MRANKIAFLVNRFPVVSETFVLRQIVGLLDAGVDVEVLCAEKGDTTTLHADYTRYKLAERTRLIRSKYPGRLAKAGLMFRFLLGSLLAPRRLISAARAWFAGLRGVAADVINLSDQPPLPDYDYVIAHFGTAGVQAMHLQQAGLLTGHLLTVFHGYDVSVHSVIQRYLPAYRRLFAHRGKCLPISDFWRARLQEWGCPSDKLEVLRMGVDVERIAFPDPARPLASPLRVLSVARLTEKKGIEYGIRALAKTTAAIQYTIIGNGDLFEELRTLARDLGVADRVQFLGEQDHQAVFSSLRQSDVFLLPSITASSGDMEGIPVALMEAMAMGILTISTRHSGIPELIEDDVSGFLVPESNADGIAAALDALSSGQHNIAAIRTAARACVERDFNARTLDTQLLRLLQTGARQPAFATISAAARS